MSCVEYHEGKLWLKCLGSMVGMFSLNSVSCQKEELSFLSLSFLRCEDNTFVHFSPS